MNPHRSALLAAVAGAALLAAVPIRAQEAPRTAAAVATLLEQARFWRTQDRPDMALRAFQRGELL